MGVVGPDNTVEIRPVKVGPRVGTLWVITEGLKPGERVIVAGLQNVRAGAVVKAVAGGRRTRRGRGAAGGRVRHGDSRPDRSRLAAPSCRN